jgi:hypothetical protein
VAIRIRGELYPSAANSLPKNQQLAAKPQSYLTSYHYLGFQNYSLYRKRSIYDKKMKKKVDIFLILCLKLLQVKKAISYHLRALSRAGFEVGGLPLVFE